jgi:hypothetical protein
MVYLNISKGDDHGRNKKHPDYLKQSGVRRLLAVVGAVMNAMGFETSALERHGWRDRHACRRRYRCIWPR